MPVWGETVFVEYADGTEAYVDNVLVQQTDLTDLTVLDVQTRFINQARYKGDTSTLTLCWPKTNVEDDLNNAHVTIRGERYRVYSSPIPYDHTNCGTMWDRLVTVLRSLFLYDADLLEASETQDEYGIWKQSFAARSVKVNLLRLAESMEKGAGRIDLEHLVMLEIPLEDYDGEEYVRFQGVRYLISDTAYSTDTVVMTCLSPNTESSNG